MSIASGLAALYARDLKRLQDQIEAFPDDDSLWQMMPGIINSGGNLALHLEGNLRDFIGRALGGVAYSRQRPLEFSTTGLPKAELTVRMAALHTLIPEVVSGLSDEQMQAPYPETIPVGPMATQDFLIHLYAHLSWHLGQMDYLRRILTASAA